MGRSKELFEYLRQSGMYSKDSPEAEQERSRADREADHEIDDADVGASTRSESPARGPRGREHDVARAMVEQLANRARNTVAADTDDDSEPVRRERARSEHSHAGHSHAGHSLSGPTASESAPVASDSGASEPESDTQSAPAARRTSRNRTTPKRRDRGAERPAARRTRDASAGAKARRSTANDKSSDSVSSLGDQTFSFSYNNAALALLFFASLTVLSYFLGFTQGMGDPVQRTPAAYMGEFPLGAARDGQAGVARDRTSEDGSPVAGEPGVGAPESESDGAGFLEGNRVFHSICVFQADARNGAIAMQHLRDLQNAGYDAWTSTDERGFHRVWVGRYEDKSQELHDLLAELKNKELQSGGELDRAYHDAYISQVTPGP